MSAYMTEKETVIKTALFIEAVSGMPENSNRARLAAALNRVNALAMSERYGEVHALHAFAAGDFDNAHHYAENDLYESARSHAYQCAEGRAAKNLFFRLLCDCLDSCGDDYRNPAPVYGPELDKYRTTDAQRAAVARLAGSIKIGIHGMKIADETIKGRWHLGENEAVFYYSGYGYPSSTVREIFAARNESDSMTDYFETTSICIRPDHPLYSAVCVAVDKLSAYWNKIEATKNQKRAERRAAAELKLAAEIAERNARRAAYRARMAVA